MHMKITSFLIYCVTNITSRVMNILLFEKYLIPSSCIACFVSNFSPLSLQANNFCNGYVLTNKWAVMNVCSDVLTMEDVF